MPQPELLKRKREIAREDQSTLYEKTPGVWVSTCPSCGMEHDVSGEVIDAGKQPECCGWKWRVFDMSPLPDSAPLYDPAWIKNASPTIHRPCIDAKVID
jgi:hypothetical protein